MRRLKALCTTVAFAMTLLGSASASAQSISFGVAAIDFGAPSTFLFFFSTPIAPVFGSVSYTVSIEGVLLDDGGGVISATPLGAGAIFSFLAGGVEVFSDPLGAITSSFGPLTYTGIFDCGVAGCSSLQADLAFLGSGDDDIYGFTGSLSFGAGPTNNVPEPGTLALLTIGLAGLGFSRHKR